MLLVDEEWFQRRPDLCTRKLMRQLSACPETAFDVQELDFPTSKIMSHSVKASTIIRRWEECYPDCKFAGVSLINTIWQEIFECINVVAESNESILNEGKYNVASI